MPEIGDTKTPPEPEGGDEFAQKAREAFERNTALAKENAFLRAGIEPDSPQGQAIVQVIGDGEFTAETVTNTAAGLAAAFGAPATTTDDPPPPPVDTNDPERQARIDAAAATTGTGDHVQPPPAPDPVKGGYERFHEDRANGVPAEDAAPHVLHAIIGDAQDKGSASVRVWEGHDEDARKREAAR